MEYTHELRKCRKCVAMVNVTALCHEFTVHSVKHKALRCPACEYAHVVRDFFECHLAIEHPEVPAGWRRYLEEVQPFTEVYHCSANACGFTTVHRDSLAHHYDVRHGWVTGINGRRVRVQRQHVPTHRMQFSLGELAELDGLYIAGWNEGLKRLSLRLSVSPRFGLYYAERAGFRVGTVSISGVGTQAALMGPNAHLPCRWPKVRALLLDLSREPWRAVATLTTEVDLDEGCYRLTSFSFADEHVQLAVSGPRFEHMYGGPPADDLEG